MKSLLVSEIFHSVDAARGAVLALEKRKSARLAAASGARLQVVEGALWLSLPGDPQDYILEAGQCRELTGDVLVSALRPSAYRLA